MLLAASVRFCPEQIGLLLDADGAVGVTLTTTEVVPAAPVHPFTVTVVEYVPAAAVLILEIVGSSDEEEKLLGPVQE